MKTKNKVMFGVAFLLLVGAITSFARPTNFRDGIMSMGAPIVSGNDKESSMWATHYFVAKTGGDGNDGKTVNRPFLTVQKALDVVADGDWIHVGPGSYSEALTTDQYGGAQNVTLIGGGSTRGDQVTLIAPTASDIVLDVRAPGYRISGFRIVGGASAAAVELNMDAASPTTGDDWAPYTQIDNCLFFGGSTHIDFVGAPYSCYILNNTFEVGTTGITSSSSGEANVNRSKVIGNSFHNMTNGISMNPRGFNRSDILNNTFGVDLTIRLDNRGGSQGQNIIGGNHFGGLFRTANGYNGHATDNWTGNFSMDTAAVGVGASGITIAVPST